MKRNKLIIFAIALITLGSCQKKLDELLVNPNTPSTDKADANLYLNTVQLNYAGFFNGASDYGMQVTRQVVMYGPGYKNAYAPESFDGLWSTAYTGIFKHVDALIPIASTNKQWVNVAMAKIMKAHTMMTLVDIFGDVPFIEANQGTANTNPVVDQGASTYAAAFLLLDDAILDLAKTPSSYPGSSDLFYGTTGSAGVARWRTAAKLLKLRGLVNTRLVNTGAKAAINNLIADADVVAATASNDFEFKYSTKQANPASRHPRYASNYQPTGSAADYIATHFLWSLVVEKGTGDAQNDPRTRYYIYRQRTNYADRNENTMSCSVQTPPPQYPPGMPFCYTVSGFWGRDHGDNSGIPPDGPLRSTVGMYPCGGQFDANQGVSVSLNLGGQGAGIEPIWLSFFTDFIKAESVLALGTNGDARVLLESGIRKSMAKVKGFNTAIGAPTAVPVQYDTTIITTAKVNNYVTKVLALYDAAATTDAKINVVAKEYWLSAWGNGIESYNLYRRTGKPDNFQLTILPNPGSFTRSMFYPSNYVNLNKNAVQKSDVNVQVYWDTNPAGFIK
jgi:hypothetical protein